MCDQRFSSINLDIVVNLVVIICGKRNLCCSHAFKNDFHLPLLQADEAYHIGPPPVRDSYLNMEKIMSIAKMSRSQVGIPRISF